MSNLKNYYFTFGQNHHTKAGLAMRNRYVRVRGINMDKATDLFIDRFASRVMENGEWSMCYRESEFEASYYPLGEHVCIDPDEDNAIGQDTIFREREYNEDIYD